MVEMGVASRLRAPVPVNIRRLLSRIQNVGFEFTEQLKDNFHAIESFAFQLGAVLPKMR